MTATSWCTLHRSIEAYDEWTVRMTILSEMGYMSFDRLVTGQPMSEMGYMSFDRLVIGQPMSQMGYMSFDRLVIGQPTSEMGYMCLIG